MRKISKKRVAIARHHARVDLVRLKALCSLTLLVDYFKPYF